MALFALLEIVYDSTGMGAAVTGVYAVVPVNEVAPPPATGAGIAVTNPVPEPKSSVYKILVCQVHGGVWDVTEINSGVGCPSPKSSGLSLLFRSGLLPLVELSDRALLLKSTAVAIALL